MRYGSRHRQTVQYQWTELPDLADSSVAAEWIQFDVFLLVPGFFPAFAQSTGRSRPYSKPAGRSTSFPLACRPTCPEIC